VAFSCLSFCTEAYFMGCCLLEEQKLYKGLQSHGTL